MPLVDLPGGTDPATAQHAPDPAWTRFVHAFVNVSSRFRAERPEVAASIERQGALAWVLYVCAANRPRLSVPVAGLPEFRRSGIEGLLGTGELVACSSPRGSAFVSPAILLDAARQLPREWQERLLTGDPVASVFGAWRERAPAPRPLTAVAVDLLAAAGDPEAAARLAGIAAAMGLEDVAALARGAVRGARGVERGGGVGAGAPAP
ncbi:hypothetical protein [Anaeromyxobacter paludicola]|uniref:Uncharacterized protein n=1 Tax=Anaeromyxobacter paludicola TaxID=2918171 RepID=A0ABN6N9S1_9BACT|nr:hypothetical protein [Anaeromyxobacter paludicola]BDG09986.1 hypothetical protein AMPC_30990 [Anaeromyxobacter paludicola]